MITMSAVARRVWSPSGRASNAPMADGSLTQDREPQTCPALNPIGCCGSGSYVSPGAPPAATASKSLRWWRTSWMVCAVSHSTSSS
jgi:hypothetical protein